MSTRTLFVLAVTLQFGILHAQVEPDQSYYIVSSECDTLREDLQAKKVVIYTYGNETYLLDYRDFAKAYYKWYKWQMKGKKSYYRSVQKGETVNEAWKKIYPAIEAFYHSARTQAASADTIRLDNSDLTKVGIGQAMDFSPLMDNGRCIIEDSAHIRHRVIIRRKATHSEGFNATWAGRLYYLPGKRTHFYGATDWVS